MTLGVLEKIPTKNNWLKELKSKVLVASEINSIGFFDDPKKIPLHQAVENIDSLAKSLFKKLDEPNLPEDTKKNLCESFDQMKKIFTKAFAEVRRLEPDKLSKESVGLKTQEEFLEFLKLLGKDASNVEEEKKTKKLNDKTINVLKLLITLQELNTKYFHPDITNNLEERIFQLKKICDQKHFSFQV